jgi:hypothetical protein
MEEGIPLGKLVELTHAIVARHCDVEVPGVKSFVCDHSN